MDRIRPIKDGAWRTLAAVRQRISPSQEEIRNQGRVVVRYVLDFDTRFERVPNGPSEQPQRKPDVRERFRVSGASSRCTGVRENRPNSWASAGRSADGETVRTGYVGGGRGTVVKPSLLQNQNLRITQVAVDVAWRILGVAAVSLSLAGGTRPGPHRRRLCRSHAQHCGL